MAQDEEDIPDETASPLQWLTRLDMPTLTAFLLGSFALGIGSMPYMGLPSKLMAGAGLVMVLCAHASSLADASAKLAVPVLASVLCLFDLFFIGSWPSWPRSEAKGPFAVKLNAHAANPIRSVGPEDWVDASTECLRSQGLRIQVASVNSQEASSLGARRPASLKKRILVIKICVSHEGHPQPSVPFSSWAGHSQEPSENPPSLSDGNTNYSLVPLVKEKAVARMTGVRGESGDGPRMPKDITLIAQPQSVTLGRGLWETLCFLEPVVEFEMLQLELPAAAFGLEGSFRFQIPKSMITTP